MGTGRKLDTDWTTGQVIGAAIDVHRHLGPGMLEHTYEVCLEAALRQRGLKVERQVPVRVRYLDVGLDCGYRIDMLVERGDGESMTCGAVMCWNVSQDRQQEISVAHDVADRRQPVHLLEAILLRLGSRFPCPRLDELRP